VQEHNGHLTRHDPIGCDQKQFYVFIVYLVHQVYCTHCGTTAEKGILRCLYHYSQERLLVYMYSLAAAHTSGVKFIYLIKGPGAYELPKSANFLTTLSDGDVSRLKLYMA